MGNVKLKSLVLVFTLLVAGAGAYFFIKPSPAPVISKAKQQVKKSLWAKKAVPKPDMSAGLPGGDLESEGSEATLAVLRKRLGFSVQLPRDPRAEAAGPPKIFGGQNVAEFAAKQGPAPRPEDARHGGEAFEVKYPNGMKMLIQIRHPDDPTKADRVNIEQLKENQKIWADKQMMSQDNYRLTTVNGFKGYEVDAGWVFMGSDEDTPTPDRRQPQPAGVYWYDDQNWAQYSVVGPEGASLEELREIVDSIY